MNLNEYQKKAHSTAVYPKEKAFEYLATGLASEAGEVASLVSKWIRGDGKSLPITDMKKELGDVLWFVSEMAYMVGTNLSEVAELNVKKLHDRQKRNTLKGSGNNR